MDLGSTIIGAISIAICTIPFGMMYYKRVKREKIRMLVLKRLAAENNCEIGWNEFCGDFVMGIDENKKFVFFLKQISGDEIAEVVDLSKVLNCQVIKKMRTVESGFESVELTESLALLFISNGKLLNDTSFELFNERVNFRLTGEIQFAEAVNTRLNELLKSIN